VGVGVEAWGALGPSREREWRGSAIQEICRGRRLVA
jgi:hypothetical protein